jgi:hypothetical protein
MGGAAYAGALLCASAAAWAFWGASVRPLAGELQKSRTDIAAINEAFAATRTDLDEARQTLTSRLALAGQPNWALLMGMIAQTTSEEVTLDQCRLEPVGGVGGFVELNADARSVLGGRANPKAEAQVGPRYSMRINGSGKTAQAVSQFVLRLQQTQLFERVSLIKTSRGAGRDVQAGQGGVAGGEHDGMTFLVDCALKGHGRVVQ